MRFHEFKTLNELTPQSALSQIATMANLLTSPPTMGGEVDGLDTVVSKALSGSKKEPSTSSTTRSMDFPAITGSKHGISPAEVSAYLKSRMDDNHRLGILANIQAESGFRPGVLGDNNTSGGLFQHHAGRFKDMISNVGSDWATDWKGQIDFALSERAGREYLSKSFNSPVEASKWWTLHFEVPANASYQAAERAKLLRNFS